MFDQMLTNVRKRAPLVHCITNYVTVNDCANILLACGGSPIMADDIREVEEITSICQALVINIGTLNERTIQSMLMAGKKANELGHPVILDPVGAGASRLRTETAFSLLENIQFSVIRGNISEIKTLCGGSCRTQGVDACAADRVSEDTLEEAVTFAKSLAKQTSAIIAMTGAIDIVANDQRAYIIRNGRPMMSRITGTGCMLTCVIGAYCAANSSTLLEAVAAAVCLMGLCGELAQDKTNQLGGGTATFRTNIIDAMSQMEAYTLKAGAKIEDR